MMLLACLPPITLLFFTFTLKKSMEVSAAVTIIITLILTTAFYQPKISFGMWHIIITSTAILILNIGFVIWPGLLLANLIKAHNSLQPLSEWYSSLPISLEYKVIILIFGIAPTIESLTGFGVSLFITVPVLLHLLETRTALYLSLLSLNAIPWGTLSLATHVAAQLSSEPLIEVAYATSLFGVLALPNLWFIALYYINGKNSFKKHLLPATILSCLFSIILLISVRIEFISLAGVLAGSLTTTIALIWLVLTRPNLKYAMPSFPIFSLLPFIAILLIITINHFIHSIFPQIAQYITITNQHVQFNLLETPGFALLIVAFLWQIIYPARIQLTTVFVATRKLLIPISCFLLIGQIILISGMMETFVAKLTSLHEISFALLFSTLAAMVSGIIIGSNVGGNALMIPIQAAIGQYFNNKILFIALQNSTCGHAIFASISIILLSLTIANNIRSQQLLTVEKTLVTFTFLTCLGIAVIHLLEAYLLHFLKL